MVLIGSRWVLCSWCQVPEVCGEFWKTKPRFREFVCAACLRRAAAAIEQARPRVLEEDDAPPDQRPRRSR